jgi:hypothetical protein
MAPRKTDIVRMILGLLAGGVTLFVLNFIMDPVPIAAGTAFALGAVGYLVMRPKAHQLVINLALVGALVGIYIHRGWHVSGSSPPPAEGLWPHLAAEGAIGLFAALLSLAAAGLVLKFLEQR